MALVLIIARSMFIRYKSCFFKLNQPQKEISIIVSESAYPRNY